MPKHPARVVDPTLEAPATMSATATASGASWSPGIDALLGTVKYPTVYDLSATGFVQADPAAPNQNPATFGLSGRDGCGAGGGTEVLNTVPEVGLVRQWNTCAGGFTQSGRATAWGDTYLRITPITQVDCYVGYDVQPCWSYRATSSVQLQRVSADLMIGDCCQPRAARDTTLAKPGLIALAVRPTNPDFFAATPRGNWHFVPDDGSAEPPACDYYFDIVDCWTMVTQPGTFRMSGYANGELKDAVNTVHVTLPAAASLKITKVAGPNAGGSFTTSRNENVLSLAAAASGLGTSPQLMWTVSDNPNDLVAAKAPPPATAGVTATVVVPVQDSSRYAGLRHRPGLTHVALSFVVTAASVSTSGIQSAPDTITQSERDVLREEYVEYHIPLPRDEWIVDRVATTSHFTFATLNEGDYNWAVIDPNLPVQLDSLEQAAEYELSVSSGFRDPMHHRIHMRPSGGQPIATRSLHQYGTAADIRTYADTEAWWKLRTLAKRAAACVEPLEKSTNNHLHVDYDRVCPLGW